MILWFLDIFSNYFSNVPAQFNEFVTHFPAYLPVIGVLIIIESLLSVDNAAVLATMVMDLPKDQREKALKYGIIGAYVFRGICLILAGFLVTVWWLKPLGGLYLLYLVYSWYRGEQSKTEEDDVLDKKTNWFYRITVGTIGNFWATVALVELMDLAFSIDNVFAAVAFTPNIIAIWIGVFIGILAMRFVAQSFVKLMDKYKFLEACAFIVIGILGMKLLFSVYAHYFPCASLTVFMEGNMECLKHNHLPIPAGHEIAKGDLITSILTVLIFFVPILTSTFFNYPKKNDKLVESK
jgi:YkoY family integral membrane protein